MNKYHSLPMHESEIDISKFDSPDDDDTVIIYSSHPDDCI